jgi:glycosyltransferase involved in cell wall biosynthesis
VQRFVRICILGKFPPIAGGVSHQTYLAAHELARRGHGVFVVTNAAEVEPEFRQMLLPGDAERLDCDHGEGFVRCVQTETVPVGSYLPWAQPYASKLFGRGLSVIEEHGCDLLVGWYLEPYGLVAAQLAAATGAPLVLRHAGSDVGRLAQNPDLRPAYDWALRRAERVLTTPSSSDLLADLGADRSRQLFLEGSRPPPYFRPDADPLDLDDVRRRAASRWEAVGLSADGGERAPYAPGTPTIGVYGKVGETKGSFDLLTALDELAAAGRAFNFLAMIGGHRRTLRAFVERVRESPALADRTTLIPFLAPWHVPAFLRHCDLTCFAERGFPIAVHAPRIPEEIMLMGSCLVCSREVAEKQFFAPSLVDGRNYLLLDDPRDTREFATRLAWALDHRDEVRAIAARGRALVQSLSRGLPRRDGHADAIEGLLV